MENENEVINSTNDTDTAETVVDLDEEVSFESNEAEDDVESLKKEIATLKAQKVHWRDKAQKVKEEVKQVESPKAQASELSTTDLYALMKHNVEQEDINDVVDYAKLKGIPVADALKSNVVKTILAEKSEERKVAQATHTGTAKRSSGKVSDEDLLANAKKGILPEDDSDITRLAKLKLK
jgi:hypothetical protein